MTHALPVHIIREIERRWQRRSIARQQAKPATRKKAQRDGLIPDTRKAKLLGVKKAGQRPGCRPSQSNSAPSQNQ